MHNSNNHVKQTLPTISPVVAILGTVAFVIMWALLIWIVMLLIGVVHSFLAIGTLGYFQTWVLLHVAQMLLIGPVEFYRREVNNG